MMTTEQLTTGAHPYAGDSAAGLPLYRNGEAVRAAIPTAGGRFVVLVERTHFEFVTAVTDAGRDGWDTGHYFPFAIPGRPVSADRRAAALGRALADLLGRASGYLDESGREAFRADLRGYVSGLFAFDACERCAARTCSVTGAVDCRARSCELHWQDAPVRLAPRDYLDDGRAGADPETECMCDACMRARVAGVQVDGRAGA